MCSNVYDRMSVLIPTSFPHKTRVQFKKGLREPTKKKDQKKNYKYGILLRNQNPPPSGLKV